MYLLFVFFSYLVLLLVGRWFCFGNFVGALDCCFSCGTCFFVIIYYIIVLLFFFVRSFVVFDCTATSRVSRPMSLYGFILLRVQTKVFTQGIDF